MAVARCQLVVSVLGGGGGDEEVVMKPEVPLHMTAQEIASATAENILGADHRPNGNAFSM